MQFIKHILSSFIALIIFSIVVLIGVVMMIAVASMDEPVSIKPNSILHIKLNKPITELEQDNPLDGLPFLSTRAGSIGTLQLLEAIKYAKSDENIKGIYLEAETIMSGYATIEEIRGALLDFMEDGKFVISYANNYSEGAYFLASAGSEVYLNPEGYVEFNGLSANMMFFKGLFDKLDIEARVFRVGEYKSAVEPYIRESMSEESKEQISEMIDLLNARIISGVALARELPENKVKNISDSMLIRTPGDAERLGFVDSLLYRDELNSLLARRSGNEEKPVFVPYEKYKQSITKEEESEDIIAVIVGQGEIIMGTGNEEISAIKLSAEIRAASEDESVKAIVLRINSPGGQLMATDIIWREVTLATLKKPVIASMSDYAASGGYYICMAADTILVQPNTITGSIGIYGIMFNMGEFMSNKLGIKMEEVNTGEFSGIMNSTRQLSEAEANIIQMQVNKGYETFTSKAATGRGMSIEALKAVASGRVWTGSQALKNGLADLEGGIWDAISVAAEKSGVEKYTVKYYPEQESFLEQLAGSADQDMEEKMWNELERTYKGIRHVQYMLKNQGVQARMLEGVVIE